MNASRGANFAPGGGNPAPGGAAIAQPAVGSPPRGWWVLTTLPPFGFLSPVGFWVAAYRAGKRSWYLWGAAWAALCYGALVVNMLSVEDSGLDGFTSLLLIVAWVGAFVHAVAIRGEYARRVIAARNDPTVVARRRLEERRRAQELAAKDPQLATELGVGRPDIGGTHAMGVVDINHADAGAIAELPGVGADLAAQLVAVREEIRGFSSVEDLGQVVDVDPALIDRLRSLTVFLPY